MDFKKDILDKLSLTWIDEATHYGKEKISSVEEIYNRSCQYNVGLCGSDAKRQKYVEDLCQRFGLNISLRLVYVNSLDKLPELRRVRQLVNEEMHTTCVMWLPDLENKARFGFAFFPFTKKEPYKPEFSEYEVETFCDNRKFEFDDIDEQRLHRMVSYRNLALLQGRDVDEIRFVLDGRYKFLIELYSNYGRQPVKCDYPDTMTPREFIDAVIKDSGEEIIDVPEYSLMMGELESSFTDSIEELWYKLNTRINVSEMTIVETEEQSYWVICYDDTEYDYISGHFALFRTRHLFNI